MGALPREGTQPSLEGSIEWMTVARCAQWRPLPVALLDEGEELTPDLIGHGSGKLSSSPSREKSRCWIRVLKDIPGCYHTSL